jgi:hypothetical protein
MGKIVVKVQEEKHLGEDKIYHLMIGVKEVYLYFKNDRNAKQYEGYYISEREFKSAMRGKTIRLQKENFIDIINPEEKISAWVERLQKQRKEFGNIRGERRGVNATVILSGVFLIGIVLLGIGFWRVQYKKNLAQRVVSTEGEVTSYTTARLQGKRYAQGYYDVHVKYQVDGVWYEGYNGTTATNQGVGAKVTVTYDPKNPAKIYVAEDMEWDPFKFFMIGGVIVLVSGALLGNEIHMKLMWKKKTVKNSKNMTLDKYFDGTIESGSYTESRIQEFDRNGEDIGKKLNDTHQMAIRFSTIAREKMGDKVDNFCIFNVNDDVNHREFSIDFEAYNYFAIRLNYDQGGFGCNIISGERMIALNNSQEWWDEANFDIFFMELQKELELRIPDEYLRAHGWL